MKVIFLTNLLGGGGAEKQLLLTAAGLAQAGHESLIITLRPSPLNARIAHLVSLARAAGVIYLEPSGLFLWKHIIQIRRLLKNNPGAIVWTWGYRADLVALLVRATGCSISIVGSLRSANALRIHKYRWIWRMLSRTHHAFISNSELNVSQVSAYAPILKRKATVIYNAIEPEFFAIESVTVSRPRILKVLMLGSQSGYTKGYDLAIKVGKLIKAAGIPIEIHIGGTPADCLSLSALVRQDKLEKIVYFLGYIDQPELFFSRGHLFMLLSRYEGTPNALLEAMALGLPAISTRVGDVAEFAKDGVHLRLIDSNADAALEAIMGLWNDWPKAMAMGRTGRELCRMKFNEAAMIEATIKVFDEVQETGAYRAAGKWPAMPP